MDEKRKVTRKVDKKRRKVEIKQQKNDREQTVE